MRALPLLALAALAACGSDPVEQPPPPPVQGSLRVEWSIHDGAGMALTCEDALVVSVELEIGGQPTTHACSASSYQLDHLLPDRYPIVAKAIGRSGAARVTRMANGVVVAGSTTTATIDFVVDEELGQKGDLAIRWRIDGRDPRTQCAVAEAAFARVVGGAGSLVHFEERVPCTQADVVLRDLVAGIYVPEVRLEKADGSLIAVGVGDAVRVVADMLSEADTVNVTSSPGRPTRLVAFWTVNSSSTPDACDTVRGREVTFATVPRAPLVASSTTVQCARGSAELTDGVAPGSATVRLTLEHGIASTTSTTVRDVIVRRGETSTVTINFDTTE